MSAIDCAALVMQMAIWSYLLDLTTRNLRAEGGATTTNRLSNDCSWNRDVRQSEQHRIQAVGLRI